MSTHLYIVCVSASAGDAALTDAMGDNSTAMPSAARLLTKVELVVGILVPIVSMCMLLTGLSLTVWCRKRKRQTETMRYCKCSYTLLNFLSAFFLRKMYYKRVKHTDLVL